MKQLYNVYTKKYKSYYVLAHNYTEAIHKVEESMLDDDEGGILTEDGSLRDKCDVDTIREIKCLNTTDCKIIL